MSLEVESILRKFNAAFCIYELAGYHSPLNVTADFAYVRLHGLIQANIKAATAKKN